MFSARALLSPRFELGILTPRKVSTTLSCTKHNRTNNAWSECKYTMLQTHGGPREIPNRAMIWIQKKSEIIHANPISHFLWQLAFNANIYHYNNYYYNMWRTRNLNHIHINYKHTSRRIRSNRGYWHYAARSYDLCSINNTIIIIFHSISKPLCFSQSRFKKFWLLLKPIETIYKQQFPS